MYFQCCTIWILDNSFIVLLNEITIDNIDQLNVELAATLFTSAQATSLWCHRRQVWYPMWVGTAMATSRFMNCVATGDPSFQQRFLLQHKQGIGNYYYHVLLASYYTCNVPGASHFQLIINYATYFCLRLILPHFCSKEIDHLTLGRLQPKLSLAFGPGAKDRQAGAVVAAKY